MAMDEIGDIGDRFELRNIDTRPKPHGCWSSLTDGDVKLQHKPRGK